MKILQKGYESDVTTVRRMAWRSMRILQKFTPSQLMMTIPDGGNYQSIRKFLGLLVRYGFVKKYGPSVPVHMCEHQGYTLLNDIGPEPPVFA